MTVRQLIVMLEWCEPEAKVFASDIYGEGVFELTGGIYDAKEVTLTGETTE